MSNRRSFDLGYVSDQLKLAQRRIYDALSANAMAGIDPDPSDPRKICDFIDMAHQCLDAAARTARNLNQEYEVSRYQRY